MKEAKDPFLRCSRWHQKLADLLFDPDEFIVLTPWCERIGHLAIELMLAISMSIRDNKKLILIPQIKSVNKEIFNCDFNCSINKRKNWKVKILEVALYLAGYFHYGYNGIRSKIVKYNIPVFSKILQPVFFYPRYGLEEGNWGTIRLKGTNYYQDWQLLLSQNYMMSLNHEQLTKGKAIREKMGIPDDAWFVCLHVREPGYMGATSRDADISNYFSTIKYITERGGFVIRLGDPTMTKLPTMDKVIDYAHSSFRSDLMDIYLVSECRFYIGCSSGPMTLAWLFRKPSCLVNGITIVSGFPIFSHDMYIPKRLYSTKKQRFISFKDEIQSPESYNNPDYVLVENSPEEILETVKEYLFFLENGKFYDSDLLQNELDILRHNRHEYLLKQDSFKDSKKDALAGTLPSQSRVGGFYLERCWEYTPYLQKLTNLYNGEE